MLAFIELDAGKTVLLCVVIVATVLALAMIVVKSVFLSREKKRKASNKSDTVSPIAESGYAEDDFMTERSNNGNMIMSRNVIYSVGLDGQLKAGKYVLQSAESANDKFNVRLNGLVKEFANGSEISLATGDTISPVSGSVILSPIED